MVRLKESSRAYLTRIWCISIPQMVRLKGCKYIRMGRKETNFNSTNGAIKSEQTIIDTNETEEISIPQMVRLKVFIKAVKYTYSSISYTLHFFTFLGFSASMLYYSI